MFAGVESSPYLTADVNRLVSVGVYFSLASTAAKLRPRYLRIRRVRQCVGWR